MHKIDQGRIVVVPGLHGRECDYYDFTTTAGSFAGSNSLGTCATTNGGYCANGDVFTQTIWGDSVTATAWNSTSPSALFSTAELFKSGSAPTYIGLGVCNSFEGTHTTGYSSCTNTEGYLDNSGSLDLILFVFSAPVDPTQITLNTLIHAGIDTQFMVLESDQPDRAEPQYAGRPVGNVQFHHHQSFRCAERAVGDLLRPSGSIERWRQGDVALGFAFRGSRAGNLRTGGYGFGRLGIDSQAASTSDELVQTGDFAFQFRERSREEMVRGFHQDQLLRLG